ncbi:MAG: hypothetical protein R3F17_10810 [Planctomycetota bacterium]
MRLLLLTLACAGAVCFRVTGQTAQEPAQAGTALRMDVESLVDSADQIVEARIVGRRTFVDEAGRLVTEYQLDVDRDFLTGSQADRTVRIPGGVLNSGRGLMLAGMPRIEVGEDVVLFLNGEELCMPTGLAQGKFRLITDRTGMRRAVRNAANLELLSAQGGSAGHGGVDSLTYAELSARVQARVVQRQASEAFQTPSEQR